MKENVISRLKFGTVHPRDGLPWDIGRKPATGVVSCLRADIVISSKRIASNRQKQKTSGSKLRRATIRLFLGEVCSNTRILKRLRSRRAHGIQVYTLQFARDLGP